MAKKQAAPVTKSATRSSHKKARSRGRSPSPTKTTKPARTKLSAQRGTQARSNPPSAPPTSMPNQVWAAMQECTTQERKFIIAYVGRAKGNVTLAGKIAGLGRKPGTTHAVALQMLRLPHVRRALDAWMSAFAMNAVELTWRIGDMAMANMGPFVEWDSTNNVLKVKPPNQETWEAHQHWVKRITADPKTGVVTDIELHDAMAAQRELAKILKLYSPSPIFAFHVHLQQLSDGDVLQRLEDARKELLLAQDAEVVSIRTVSQDDDEDADDGQGAVIT